MNHASVQFHIEAGILEVRLCRPHRLNAFTPEMAAELLGVLQRGLAAAQHVAIAVALLSWRDAPQCVGT